MKDKFSPEDRRTYSRNSNRKRQVYFAAGLILLWFIIFLAIEYGFIKS
jgi:hypothetical protein